MSAAELAARLPDLGTTRAWARALAAVEAVVSPEWEYRYFSFDATWADDEQMASMRNGSGDEWSITFTPAGAYLRGFDHESPLSPYGQQPYRVVAGLLEPVPPELREAASDPAWHLDGVPGTTLSLWRLSSDDGWHHGRPEGSPAVPDGSELFDELDGDASTYTAFASDYYEVDVDQGAVEHVYAGRPVTEELARRLNPACDWRSLVDDLRAIGHPVQA